jgi:hypothetical protein
MAFFGRKEKRQEKTDFLCDDLSATTNTLAKPLDRIAKADEVTTVFLFEAQTHVRSNQKQV